MFTLTVKDETAPGMRGIIRSLTLGLARKGEINKAVGRAASQLTRAHLYSLAASRHRGHGGLNFYEDAADAVSDHDMGGGVEIRIDKAGMDQRFHGGRIKALNYSHLWIPLSGTEAEGRSAGEFDNLVPIISPLTNRGVALKDGIPLFALVEEIEQDPDDSVLPTAAEYAEAGADGMNTALDAILARNIETRPFVSNTIVGRDQQGRFKRVRR